MQLTFRKVNVTDPALPKLYKVLHLFLATLEARGRDLVANFGAFVGAIEAKIIKGSGGL